ncbi:MAG: hypothetical protein Kow00121_07880 [Elainellaceae cyanobacterium]
MSSISLTALEGSQVDVTLQYAQQQIAQLIQLIQAQPQSDLQFADFLALLTHLVQTVDQFIQQVSPLVTVDPDWSTESRQLLDSLPNSKLINHDIFKAVPDLLIRMRQDGQYLDVLSGTSVKLVQGGQEHRLMNIYQCLPYALAQQRMEYVQRAIATRELQVYEYEIVIDGEVRYEEARIIPNGSDQVLVIVRDITDHRRAELALRESEEQFRQILENIQDVFFLKEIETNQLIYLNSAYERLHQCSRDVVFQNPDDWLRQIHPDDRAKVSARSQQEIQGQAFGSLEYRIVLPDGSVRWIWDHTFPIRDQTGRIYRFAGVNRDITDWKNAEETLRLQFKREQLLMQISSRIRQSLDLEAIWNTAVEEVRHFLNADRVLFYQFSPDWSGIVVAESVGAGWRSMQGHYVKDHCLADDAYINAYTAGRVHLINNVERAGLSACHLEFLQQWQVRANLLVPILQGQQLYGLFAVQQCDRPREWQPWEVEFLQKISDHFSIALQQSQLYEQTQRQAQHQQALNRVTQLIRNSLEIATIFTTATTEIGKLLQADQVNLVQYHAEQQLWKVVGSYCDSAEMPIVLGAEFSDNNNPVSLVLKQFQTVCVSNASIDIAALAKSGLQLPANSDPLCGNLDHRLPLQNAIHQHLAQICSGAWLIIPLRVGDHMWGNLTLIHRGRYHHWQPPEIELVSAVADQLAIAIQQSQLYQQLQLANQELERLATTDGLTQVANRLRFDTYLSREWQRLTREQQPLSLILFDVDYFKHFNDQLGHPRGDVCLFQIAQAARQAVRRPADLLARYGGEEFAVILPNTDLSGARAVAEAIQKEIRALQLPHPRSEISVWITISLGCATTIPASAVHPSTLIEAADRALYEAKHRGRNQIATAEL